MTTVSGQHVSDYMHRQLEVVPQDTSVVTVATKMRTRSVGSVLIECFDRPHNDCRIAGIVTETDLVAKVLAPGRSSPSCPTSSSTACSCTARRQSTCTPRSTISPSPSAPPSTCPPPATT